jgi:hypothetical protein
VAGLHFVVFGMLMLPKVAMLLASGASSQHPLACYAVQNEVPVATQWLHGPKNKKPRYLLDSGVSIYTLGWLMALEPTTTGSTSRRVQAFSLGS